MELSELSRINHQDGVPKETSRTIKPEDRCVISYNFEQTHSHNYTHNLLIGMFGPPNKKINKNLSQLSIQPPKSKVTTIAPHPKKIYRQDPNTIARVYDNQIDPTKYVNQFSGRRGKAENRTDHQATEKSDFENSKIKNEGDTFFSKDNEDLPIQIDSLANHPFRQSFNEVQERRRSPYHSKNQKKPDARIKQNSIDSLKKEKYQQDLHPETILQNKDEVRQDRDKENSNYSSKPHKNRSFEGRKEGKNSSHHSTSSNKFGKEPQKEMKTQLHFYGKKNNSNHILSNDQAQFFTSPSKNVTDLLATGNHLKKVTENELQVNERESKHEDRNKNHVSRDLMSQNDYHIGISQNCNGQIEIIGKTDKKDEIKSRKQIQEEQMRQIEQMVRRQESKEFKKGYFKILNHNSKEFLPFNADLEPVMHISKKKGINPSSTNKTTLYKESRKEQLKLNHLNRNQKENSVSRKLMPQDPNGLQNKLLFNEKGINKHTSVDNSDLNQKMTSKYKVRSPEQASQTLNNFNQHSSSYYKAQSKGFSQQKQKIFERKGDASKLHVKDRKTNPNTRVAGSSFNIKRPDKLQNKNRIEGISNDVQNEDITANNQIRGYKMLDKNERKIGQSLKNNKGQTSLNYSSNLDLGLKMESQKTKGIQKQPNISSKQAKISTIHNNKIVSQSDTTKRDQNLKKGISKDHFSKSKENMSAKVKSRKNDSIDQTKNMKSQKENHEKVDNSNAKTHQHMQSPPFVKKSSKERSESKSKTIEATIPRLAQEKTRKFKNWKQSSDREKERKLSRKFSQLSPQDKRLSMNSVNHKRSKDARMSQLSNVNKEIDLDAEQQDPFGLLAQKNVTQKQKKNKKGKEKKMKPSKFREEKQKREEEGEEEEEKEKEKEKEEEEKKKRDREDENHSFCSSSQEKDKSDSLSEINEFQAYPDNKNKQGQPNSQNIVDHTNPQENPAVISTSSEKGEKRGESPKKQGVQQIEHLIEENGSQISSIDDEDSILAQKPQTKYEHSVSEKQIVEEESQNKYQIIVTPDQVNETQNLENLLKATEEVNPNQKQLEPILNNVEVELGQPNLENPSANEEGVENKVSSTEVQKEGNNPTNNIPSRLTERKSEDPYPEDITESKHNHNHQSPRVGIEVQSDYHEEEMDKIEEMPENTKEHNKSEDFFQCNLNQTSKISDPNLTINFTKYQVIDKDTTNYTRAPILSFIYEVPKEDSFISSPTPQFLLKNIKKVDQINEEIIDQAVNIIISIDPWIIQRIFEPFEDNQGKIGVWLYCFGIWKLFLENKKGNFRLILREVVAKAFKLINGTYELETVIKLISGVRVMKLKSGKGKIFNQLQYSLRKGHVIKAYTSKDSKWKGKVFEVAKVETTRQNENVLQIRQQNDTYWVKQEKFKSIFQHFLLICTRHSHFWTHRPLQQKPEHKIVLTITSHVPSHGSLTLFYPSAEKSSLLLYKELQSKVLKYMGKIEEKANQNGNLYFQFRLHGTYSLFLDTPTSCLLGIESTTPLEIESPEFILKETLKNDDCEYVQLSQNRSKERDKQGRRNNDTLEKLRETFIRMVVKK